MLGVWQKQVRWVLSSLDASAIAVAVVLAGCSIEAVMPGWSCLTDVCVCPLQL